MKKIPASVDDFQTLIENGYFYADKTRHLYRLATSDDPNFLSRPRRFGKTLLVNALEAVLRGNKELFKGLWIYDSDYDWRPWPVIHLSLASADTDSLSELKEYLISDLKDIAETEELKIYAKGHTSFFKSLIKKMCAKHGRKVAVLIDEYDAPILSEIENPKLAEKIRDSMGKFYGVLKDCSQWRGPTFITGVTKFAQTSLFSKLNNLTDLTLNSQYNDICGLTYEELDAFLDDQSGAPKPGDPSGLAPILGGFIEKGKLPIKATVNDLRDKILSKYDGYTWDGKTRLLNPWSVFGAFKEKSFSNFWLATGPPKFLSNTLFQSFQLEDIFKSDNYLNTEINAIDIGKTEPVALLFQAGYLTVDRVDERSDDARYYLRFPNAEVEAAMYRQRLCIQRDKAPDWLASFRAKSQTMLDALRNLDAPGFQKVFSSILASIPLSAHAPLESHYQAILLMTLGTAGQLHDSQVPSGDGIYDSHLRTSKGDDFVIKMKYVSGTRKVGVGKKAINVKLAREELAEKMERKAEEALRQIEEKKYDLRFKGEGNKIYKTALVIGRYSDVLIVFEEADNWRLVQTDDGLLSVQET